MDGDSWRCGRGNDAIVDALMRDGFGDTEDAEVCPELNPWRCAPSWNNVGSCHNVPLSDSGLRPSDAPRVFRSPI